MVNYGAEIMTQSAELRLAKILSEDGRTLINLKFFSGDQACTAEQLMAASSDMFELAFRGKSVIGVPATQGMSRHIDDLVP